MYEPDGFYPPQQYFSVNGDLAAILDNGPNGLGLNTHGAVPICLPGLDFVEEEKERRKTEFLTAKIAGRGVRGYDSTFEDKGS